MRCCKMKMSHTKVRTCDLIGTLQQLMCVFSNSGSSLDRFAGPVNSVTMQRVETYSNGPPNWIVAAFDGYPAKDPSE